jgi:hypothetical protein
MVSWWIKLIFVSYTFSFVISTFLSSRPCGEILYQSLPIKDFSTPLSLRSKWQSIDAETSSAWHETHTAVSPWIFYFRVYLDKRFLPFVISTLWRDPLSKSSNKRFLDYAIATLEMTKHAGGCIVTIDTIPKAFGLSMTRHTGGCYRYDRSIINHTISRCYTRLDHVPVFAPHKLYTSSCKMQYYIYNLCVVYCTTL